MESLETQTRQPGMGLEGPGATGKAVKLVKVPLFQLQNGPADVLKLSGSLGKLNMCSPATKPEPSPAASRAEPTSAPGRRGLPALSPAWVRIGLAILTVLCLAPFLGKAIHIDDTLFVWAAKHIVKHPLDPYGFSLVWAHTAMPMHEVNWNPPLAAYYAALTGAWAGWSELHLHLAFLLPAVIVVLGVYRLGRGLCDSPVLAAALTLAAPGFLVSSTSLMCDVPMLALWMVAVGLWRDGLETENPIRLGASAFLMAACVLTKYFGACLIPLLLLYSIWKKRRLGLWALYFLIPVCILAGYGIWTRTLYGHDLLSYAPASANQAKGLHLPSPIATPLLGLSFLGGCALPALTFAPWLWQKRGILVVLAFSSVSSAAVALRWLVVAPFPCDHQWFLAFQLTLFIAGGLSAVALAWYDFWRRREADSFLLLAWVWGTFIFAAFVNWTVNVRSLLPLVPPVGILIVRKLGSNPKRGAISWILIAPLTTSLLLSLWVAWGDTKLANSAREAAEVIHRATAAQSGKVIFQGHWGFQYYMELFGARPLDFRDPDLSSSNTIVRPFNNSHTRAFSSNVVNSSGLVAIDTRQWVATMHLDRSAGFYTSAWGALPFAFGPTPVEKYELSHPSALGAALYKGGQIDEAIRHYQEALRLKPDDVTAHYNLGIVLAEKGQIDEAISQLQKTIRLKPDDAKAHNNLGVAFGRKGQIDEAIHQFQEAIRLKPDYADAYNNLGYTWVERGENLDQARAMLERAVRLQPNNAVFLDSLGWVLFKLNRPREALDYLLKAIENSRKPDAALYDHLGDVYAALNQRDQAAEAWRKSLSVEPNRQIEKKLADLAVH